MVGVGVSYAFNRHWLIGANFSYLSKAEVSPYSFSARFNFSADKSAVNQRNTYRGGSRPLTRYNRFDVLHVAVAMSQRLLVLSVVFVLDHHAGLVIDGMRSPRAQAPWVTNRSLTLPPISTMDSALALFSSGSVALRVLPLWLTGLRLALVQREGVVARLAVGLDQILVSPHCICSRHGRPVAGAASGLHQCPGCECCSTRTD